MSDDTIDLDQEFEVITREQVITIDVSGYFYERLRHFLNTLQEEDSKKYLAAVVKLQKDLPENAYEYNLSTILIFINTIEEAAKKQKKLSKITVGEVKKLIEDQAKDES